jgi:hypothetical protein
MTDTAKAAISGGDLRLQHARDPVAEPHIGMADNAGAEPRRPVTAARAHCRRPVNELGLPDGLQLDRPLGAIHRATLDKNGLRDVVTATGVGE